MDQFDDVFTASYARVMGDGAYNPNFIARFYEVFIGSSPAVAERFSTTDMSRQKTMLHDSFTTLMDFNQHRRLSPQMEHLAKVHSRAGNDIPPDLYNLWLESLMKTVAEFDPQFDRNIEVAWRLTLAPGISYLQFAYAH